VRMFQHPDMTPLLLRLAARELIAASIAIRAT